MAYSSVLGSERSFTRLIRVSCSVERIRTKMKFAVNLSKQTTDAILNWNPLSGFTGNTWVWTERHNPPLWVLFVHCVKIMDQKYEYGMPPNPMALISNYAKMGHQVRKALKADQSHPYEHVHTQLHTDGRSRGKGSGSLALHRGIRTQASRQRIDHLGGVNGMFSNDYHRPSYKTCVRWGPQILVKEEWFAFLTKGVHGLKETVFADFSYRTCMRFENSTAMKIFLLWSAELRSSCSLYVETNVLDEHTASIFGMELIFYPEHWASVFIRDVGSHLP
jgi:hypothetical protein